MPNALVTGANGFIGRAVCARLLSEGWHVRGVIRPCRDHPDRLPVTECSVVNSIGPETEWKGILRGVNLVIHLAGRVHVRKESEINPLSAFRRINAAGTKHLSQSAASAGVGRFVFLSTVGVHGNSSGTEPISETTRVQPYDDYTLSKWEAEQQLAEVSARTGIESVVLRSPMVYGPRDPGNLLRLLRLVQSGFPLPFGAVRNKRSLIFLGNLVHALIACATHSKASTRTYLVSDGEPVSIPELIRAACAALGRPVRLVPCPPAWLRAMGALLGRRRDMERLLGSLAVDISRIQDELGWSPKYSIHDGLKDTADWYLAAERATAT